MKMFDKMAISVKQNGKEIRRIPWMYVDEKTGIKKPRFVIACRDCARYRTSAREVCKLKGCMFANFYEHLNKELSEYQKHRIVKIYMSGYHR